MKFFDAHNHVNSELYGDDWKAVVESAEAAGVVGMINNGGDLASSARAVEQAAEFGSVYATTGIHPEDFPLKTDLDQQMEDLKKLAASSDKVVAIGELGLDYTLDVEGVATVSKQIDLIEPQLALAESMDLPVVLHVRDVPGSTECFEDIMRLLKQYRLRGQFHCWTGSIEQMDSVLGLDTFYISFSGILTYGSAGQIVDVAREVPAERMLVETDGPFLVPEPRRTAMRKEGLRNSERLCLPEHVIMTAEKLAEIRQVSVEEIARTTTNNALQLFGLSRYT